MSATGGPRRPPAAVRRPGEPDHAIRLGVFAALHDHAGRLLLLHRNDWDMWCLPGGLFEHGESVTDCLRRECAEELGTDVELDGLLGVYSDPSDHLFTFRDGRRVQYVTLVFLGKAPSGPIAPCTREVREVGLFASGGLPRLVPSHRVWIEDSFRGRQGPFVR